DIPEILSIAEFYVHPTITEALGIAILEAMAMGKAVVASRVDGVPELVIDGETGLLVPPEDPGAMSRAIIELLQSPPRAREMGQKGRERALSHFSAEKSAGELDKIYEQFALTKILTKEKSLRV
ncbi:MAG: glycosyltransferase family 4 protein, partial [Candidatus Brocadiales bacterium]